MTVCALTGKRLDLSTPNLVHMYSVVVARQRGQKVEGQGHTVTKTITVACDVLLQPCRYDCLCFLVYAVLISVDIQVCYNVLSGDSLP